MKTNKLLKIIAILLTVAVSTIWAQRDWSLATLTATDGEVIRIASAGALGTLTVPAGATITIVSDGEEPIARTATLNFIINAGATVRWEAKIATSGTVNAVSLGASTGTFEVHFGAIIRQIGTAAGDVIVGNGGVRITVLGGEVSAVGTGSAIISTNNTANNVITVSGGVVSAVSAPAIVSSANGTLNIAGGLVIAQGTVIFVNWNTNNNNVLSKAPTNKTGGLVVAYPATSGLRVLGQRGGLLSLPVEADISWVIDNERIGIKYNRNEFFATTGTQQFWDGIINTAADLVSFRNRVNAGNNSSGETIMLGADIELTGNSWTPIGNSFTSFSGIFDGNGKVVRGVSNRGLFGEFDGTIKKTGVEVDDIPAQTGSGIRGGLVEVNRGRIENSFVIGNISNSREIVGGLVGINRGTIEASYANVTITVPSPGTVVGSIGGGLVGENTRTISNSFVIGNVNVSRGSAGGLVGIYRYGGTIIENCYTAVNVQGSSFVGGLVGSSPTSHNTSQTINSYYSGNVNGNTTGSLMMRTESQMRMQGTFVNWDFNNIWGINPNINEGFPYLRGISGSGQSMQNTIVFDSQGGSSHSSITREAGSAIILPTPTKGGYVFAGWFSAASGGTRFGGGGDSYTITQDRTMFAQWTTSGGNNNSSIVGTWEWVGSDIDAHHSVYVFNADGTGNMSFFNAWHGLNESHDFTYQIIGREIMIYFNGSMAWAFHNDFNYIQAMPGNFFTHEVHIRTNGGGTFIRPRQPTDNRFGILLENAIVSDFAEISVITPESATVNLAILDNLGNVVFTADDVRAGLIRSGDPVSQPAPTADGTIIWNLTNQSGRFVANGTYLIIVEAKGISGRVYKYQLLIGVKR